MNKPLLTTTLAIVGSLFVTSSALAAPGVAYKKRLDTPSVPATIVKQVEAASWRYTTDKGTRYQPTYATYTNVIVEKPVLVAEKDCGSVTYRLWSFNLDLKQMRKKYPNIVPSGASNEYDDSFYGSISKYVFEARSGATTQWKLDPKGNANYSFDSLLGCKNNDLIVMNTRLTEKGAYLSGGNQEVRTINYRYFSSDKTWNVAPDTIAGSYQIYSVDGIKQRPGTLVATKSATANQITVTGDSRVATFDGGYHLHTIPRYRDLTAIASVGEKIYIKATFYRLKDGYGVMETDLVTNKYTYYRIHDGEGAYTQVTSLPLDGFSSAIEPYSSGVQLVVMNKSTTTGDYTYPYYHYISVHGLPTGHNYTSNVYHVSASILWETDAQVYMRYLITDKFTGKQQYWEATVNKN
ncbi:MAG: hypothetical protein U0487_03915 [Patescibacteria group bacterium]